MSGSPTASRTSPVAVPGAGGVVFDPTGRVLILGHADGAWVFPKGHIEGGETSQAAAVREVAEEAGIEASIIPDSPSWTTRYRNDRGVLRAVTWFACRTEARGVTITEDTFTTGGFFPPAVAMQRLTHESDRELLSAVLSAVDVSTAGAA